MDEEQLSGLAPKEYDARDDAVVKSEELGAKWQAVGASIRGRMHHIADTLRQDAFTWVWVDPWLIGCLADGGGAYPRAREGAMIAARNAALFWQRDLCNGHFTSSMLNDDMKLSLDRVIQRTKKSIIEMAIHEQSNPMDYATTLLLCGLEIRQGIPLRIASMTVGDGAIYIMHKDSQTSELSYRVWSSDIYGDYGNQTIFLQTATAEQWQSTFTIDSVPDNFAGLIMMTDGVADDFPVAAPQTTQFIQNLWNRIGNGYDPQQQQENLIDLLDYRMPGSGYDDRTLLYVFPFHQANTQERLRDEKAHISR